MCWKSCIVKSFRMPTGHSCYSWSYYAICIYYFILSTWLVHILKINIILYLVFIFITNIKRHVFLQIRQSAIGSSTVPILKPEAVTGDLPHGLVTVGCSLSRQKEVLVEEAQFVPFKLDCPTRYNKQSGLALRRLLCQRKKQIPVLISSRSRLHITSWNVHVKIWFCLTNHGLADSPPSELGIRSMATTRRTLPEPPVLK